MIATILQYALIFVCTVALCLSTLEFKSGKHIRITLGVTALFAAAIGIPVALLIKTDWLIHLVALFLIVICYCVTAIFVKERAHLSAYKFWSCISLSYLAHFASNVITNFLNLRGIGYVIANLLLQAVLSVLFVVLVYFSIGKRSRFVFSSDKLSVRLAGYAVPTVFVMIFVMDKMVRMEAQQEIFNQIIIGFYLFLAPIAALIGALYSKLASVEEKIRLAEVTVSRYQKDAKDVLPKVYEDIDKARILRHDVKHHLIAVLAMIENDKSKEAIDYIKQLTRKIDDSGNETLCANVVLNSLFKKQFALAGNNGVKVVHTILIPKLTIDDASLCVIFGNLLENAVDAAAKCEGEKFVNFSVVPHISSLIIKLENSHFNTIKLDRNNIPVTSKTNGGLGIKSVIGLVEELGGYYNARFDDKVYTTNIFLPNAIKEEL